jgi:hypothetical protein
LDPKRSSLKFLVRLNFDIFQSNCLVINIFKGPELDDSIISIEEAATIIREFVEANELGHQILNDEELENLVQMIYERIFDHLNVITEE